MCKWSFSDERKTHVWTASIFVSTGCRSRRLSGGVENLWNSDNFYHPPTKLWESNVFNCVCLNLTIPLQSCPSRTYGYRDTLSGASRISQMGGSQFLILEWKPNIWEGFCRKPHDKNAFRYDVYCLFSTVTGGSLSRGVSVRVKSGWYTSYWNAFLSFQFSILVINKGYH